MKANRAIAALLGAVLLWIWYRLNQSGKAVEVATDGDQKTDLSTVGEYADVETQANAWARAIGVPRSALGDIGDLEDMAIAAGAPEDWEFVRKWPSPCGPKDDPKRFCKWL